MSLDIRHEQAAGFTDVNGAQLAIDPGASHAFLFRHAERFADDVTRFLARA
jgi:pimeloyl-ACP methyl ester carboxylesterase